MVRTSCVIWQGLASRVKGENSIARLICSLSGKPVRMMTGSKPQFSRICCNVSAPPICGISKSVTTISGSSCLIFSKATAPFAAIVTLNPSQSKALRISSSIRGSSSTMSTWVASEACSLGMTKQNVLPLPNSLSTQIFPPCDCTSSREIYKPRPTPCWLPPSLLETW